MAPELGRFRAPGGLGRPAGARPVRLLAGAPTGLAAEQGGGPPGPLLDERRRIGRELHDVIAHSVSVMTVQAGAVRRWLAPAQEREREALLALEATGRDALAEMRRLVGLLEEEAEGASRYAPQPGLAALAPLLGRVREAGLAVELAVEGRPRTLAPGLDLTAFRVVQEALADAVGHDGAWAEVRVRWAERELRIEVVDPGADGGRGTHASPALAGVRGRVALYGGRLESGPRTGGGHLVRATVPLGEDA